MRNNKSDNNKSWLNFSNITYAGAQPFKDLCVSDATLNGMQNFTIKKMKAFQYGSIIVHTQSTTTKFENKFTID